MVNCIVEDMFNEVYLKWRELCDNGEHNSKDHVINQFFTEKHRIAVKLLNFNNTIEDSGVAGLWENGMLENDLRDIMNYAKRGYAQRLQHFNKVFYFIGQIQDVGKPEDYTTFEKKTIECENCGGWGYLDVANTEPCPRCSTNGFYEEETEIDGEEKYKEKLNELTDFYMSIDREELFISFDQLIARYDEKVDISNVKFKVKRKPTCKLSGENGNIFHLLGVARRVLRNYGLIDEIDEMSERVTSSHSYTEAFSVIGDYVNII